MLEPGTDLGAYRIVAPVGGGAMGELYRATDLKLGRDVAIKTLRPEFASDRDRIARFEQEARAASALNHPNIVTLYDVGEHGGTRYIAMELVDGETVRTLLERKPLPLQTILDIGIQVSEGLHKAHAGGIVHRDLKPENLMMTRDGFVKILDFGLAKLAPGLDVSSAITAEAPRPVTESGMVVGTFGYMSPEQARGERVDFRTDLFSLGVVLYELATGMQPFAASTAPLLFEAILNRAPPPASSVNPDVSPELERIIHKSLEKDRKARYRDAAELGADLKLLRRATDAGIVLSLPKRRWELAVGGALMSAVLAVWLFSSFGDLWDRPAFVDLDANFSQLTSAPGQELYPTLTPDGRSFVYASAASGDFDILLRRVGGENVLNLTEASAGDDVQPALSRDGEHIAFRSSREGGGVYVMGATGENVTRLTDFGFNPAWSPDGAHVVVATESISTNPRARSAVASELWVIERATRQPRRLFGGDAVQPSWSPNGFRIAYWGIPDDGGAQRDVFTISAGGGEPVAVTRDPAVDWNPVWSPDGGYLYFSSDRTGSVNLWRVPIDERSGETLGAPEPVTTGASGDNMHLSLSSDGKRMAYVIYAEAVHIKKVDLDAARDVMGGTVPVTTGSVRTFSHDVSPDGEAVVYRTVGGREDLFIRRGEGTTRRLTDDVFNARSPRWSVDDKIAFLTDRGGDYSIWTIDVNGGASMQLTAGVGEEPVWSHDGARIAYQHGGVTHIIRADTPASEQAPIELPPPPADLQGWHPWAWSPDGRWLAGHVANAAGVPRQDGIAVYAIASETYEAIVTNGRRPRWFSDSQELVYENRGSLYVVDRVAKTSRALATSEGDDRLYWPVPSPDDRTLYYTSIPPTQADVWLLTLP